MTEHAMTFFAQYSPDEEFECFGRGAIAEIHEFFVDFILPNKCVEVVSRLLIGVEATQLRFRLRSDDVSDGFKVSTEFTDALHG